MTVALLSKSHAPAVSPAVHSAPFRDGDGEKGGRRAGAPRETKPTCATGAGRSFGGHLVAVPGERLTLPIIGAESFEPQRTALYPENRPSRQIPRINSRSTAETAESNVMLSIP